MTEAGARKPVSRPRLGTAIRVQRGLIVLGKVLFAALLVGFVMAPMLGVLSTSVADATFWDFPPSSLTAKWYAEYFTTPELLNSTYVSIAAALFVGIVGPALAVLTALALARSRVRRTGAAQLILVMPLVTGLLTTGLEGIRPNVERAAANLGAGTAGILFRVTLPLLRPALVAAAIIAFVRSFDDSAIALFINSPDTTTLPIRMLLDMQENTGPLIAVCGSVLLIIAVALAVILDRVIGLSRAFGLHER